VEIRLHGRLVRSVKVINELEDGGGLIRMPLAESLLRYVPGPEALELTADGVQLPVDVCELPDRPDALGVEALDARLAEGHFVTKFGGLRLPLELDVAWQERTFDHYAHVRATMLELFGYDVNVAYGTLLGIAREGAFISSDDDFDTTYHSRQTKARDVRDELFEIATTLAARGEDVQLSGRKFLHWYSPRGAKLDVFPAWTRGEDYFQTHVVGGPHAAVFAAGYHEIEFKGRAVSAPIDAEGALAATYGPGWRTPDPLFQWRVQPAARPAMRAVRLTAGQISLVQWERMYAAALREAAKQGVDVPPAAPGGPPSDFARTVAGMLGPRIRAVVDLGCGDGRDTLTVAGGRPALGIDGSRAAIAAAQRRFEHAAAPAGTSIARPASAVGPGTTGAVRLERLDVDDAPALTSALDPLTTTGRIAVYARGLVDSVEERTELVLLRSLRRSLPAGSLVFLEFTTCEAPPAALDNPLHRGVDPDRLVRRWLRGAYFAIELLEHDPEQGVARVGLRRRSAVGRRWHQRSARVQRRLRRTARRVRRRLSRGSRR